ncbi:MAG: energy-coupled thiamine transporter ThiT [Clostridia bacterium]|nr:energy-coupled thiamine transporter ThiT [Clostridia bacterium]
MKNKNTALKLTESAMMIALATVLSFLKLANLPYGGSITIASMLPIVIIAVRYGVPWGLFTGIVHGTLQLIIDPSPLSYFTSPASLAAIIIIDYIVAFGVIGVCGAARKISNPSTSLCTAAFVAGLLRYVCHVVSGATVWAGLSIPTSAALLYSFAYNATYMLPETLVLMCTAYFIASSVDFRSQRLSVAKKGEKKVTLLSVVAIGVFMAGIIFAVVSVFSKIQNGDTGEFDITGIADVNWILVSVVCAVSFAASALLTLIDRKKK